MANKFLNNIGLQHLVSKIKTNYVTNSSIGIQGGIASLDSNGKVPTSQLPSYVDDVIEFATFDEFPLPGEKGIIYMDASTGNIYRWTGSSYLQISGLIGAQGYQGYQGYQGIQGYQGYQGFQGYQGLQGIQGYQGYQGFQGYQGKSGVDGIQGFQGLQGRGVAEVYVHYSDDFQSGIPPITAGEYTLAEYEALWNSMAFAEQQDFNHLMWNIESSSYYTNTFISPDLVMTHPEFRPNNYQEGNYVCFYGRGQNGLQGIQGIKGDNSNIRAREVNEITNYDRKYINISTVGVQSVVEHALVSPTSSISTVDINLNSASPAQIQIPSYEFDNAGHNKKQNITNVNLALGFKLADKNINPSAGLLTNEVPDNVSDLKGWVYGGNITKLQDLENLKVGDIVTFHSWVPALTGSNGQVYIGKKQDGKKFEQQCKFTVTRYAKQQIGYTSDNTVNDSKYLTDYAFMHQLPEHYNLTVLTTDEELKSYKNTLTEYYNSYGKFHYATNLYYTNPNGDVVEGVCYWRIQNVDSIIDFGDEVPVSTLIANQIASSTESLTRNIASMTDSLFVSAWILSSSDESYEENRTEGTYIWNIAYSRLIQNDIDPESASVITLRQLQENGMWKQLIPDVVFNDNTSCLEIHFSYLPKNTMKVLVTGKRIEDYFNENPDEPDEPAEPEPDEPTGSIGSITDDNSIVIDETQLENGTYTLRYIDSNENSIDNFNEITSFEVNK
jgi:hypothetical protein